MGEFKELEEEKKMLSQNDLTIRPDETDDENVQSALSALLSISDKGIWKEKKIICNSSSPTYKVEPENYHMNSDSTNEMINEPVAMTYTCSRRCEAVGCQKFAQGSTKFCISHGGGRRCTFYGCSKGARDKYFCAAHGGGKRCIASGCNKSAVGTTNACTAHGGGRKCQYDGCQKSAQSPTIFCVKHGGGRTCKHEGCSKV